MRTSPLSSRKSDMQTFFGMARGIIPGSRVHPKVGEISRWVTSDPLHLRRGHKKTSSTRCSGRGTIHERERSNSPTHLSSQYVARQELAPYLSRSWEQRRGCQDFTGPEPSVLLDEHNVKLLSRSTKLASFSASPKICRDFDSSK